MKFVFKPKHNFVIVESDSEKSSVDNEDDNDTVFRQFVVSLNLSETADFMKSFYK